MPWHEWGDEWPYWGELDRAQEYFCSFYYKCTGKHPITKEKYGTIRFEYTYLWIENAEHCRIFREGVMRTVKKFPNVAGELCSDAGHTLSDDFFSGWCAGVIFKACGTYWSSIKRPNGV